MYNVFILFYRLNYNNVNACIVHTVSVMDASRSVETVKTTRKHIKILYKR